MTVRFSSVQDVREFAGLASLQSFPVLVEADGRQVNANSFMEMCTLAFRKPLQVDIQDPENEKNLPRRLRSLSPDGV